MKIIRHALWILLLAHGAALAAPPEQPQASGIESDGYDWSSRSEELAAALARRGDPAAGRTAYEYCQGCHRADGSGRPDGIYPQIAGQHATVLIKQMVDIREGRRDNPIMYPFAGDHLIKVYEVADIAAYLAALPIPTDNGRGPGTALDLGQSLYAGGCRSCHGERGEGDGASLFPMLAGQHYAYLLRQIREIKEGVRRNANPEMVAALQGYRDDEMEAVADYLSRLPPPVTTREKQKVAPRR